MRFANCGPQRAEIKHHPNQLSPSEQGTSTYNLLENPERMAEGEKALKSLEFSQETDPVSLLSSNNYLDQLVPIIKAHLKHNTVQDLVRKLKSEGAKKDEELVSTVSDFEESIGLSARDVSEISHGAASMNEQIMDIGSHLAKTSNLTFEKKFQLLALKKNIIKMEESEILISKILQVLELTDATHTLIKENKFFNALKNLNDLNNLNKEFDRDFKFLNNINESIPILKDLIKDESLGLMKKSLSALDNKFEILGTEYFNTYGSIISRWDEFKTQRVEFADYKINSPVEISMRSSYLQNDLPDVSQYMGLSFIYDTQLIFNTLEQTDFLREELNKEIVIRRDKLLHPFIASDSKNVLFQQHIKDNEKLSSFLAKLIGYLVFHKSLSDRLPDIISVSANDMWENLSAKVYSHLKNLILNEMPGISGIIDIKRIVGNFCLVLEHFDLNHDHFYNLLILAFKKYSQISIFAFTKEFSKSADDDDAMPMSIYDMRLYKKITNVCWYEADTPANEIQFPLTLPFSTIYPMACAQVRNFMGQQNSFLKDYYKYDVSSLNSLCVDNVDSVLLNAINKYHLGKLNESVTREELSQNLINLEYFLIMANEISSELSDNYDTAITLKSVDAFSMTRKQTEEKLLEFIDSKIYDLLDLVDWDWKTHVVNTEPTFFIRDVSDFLQNLFNSALLKLPLSVKTVLLYRVFDLIAEEFWRILIDQNVITKVAVMNFDRDICYIEAVTKDLNPSKSDLSGRDSLLSMFLKLRQAINLLKMGHLDEYRDQGRRMRYFDHVKPEEATMLISRLQD